MAGQRVLVPLIGVRIPIPEPKYEHHEIGVFIFVS